MAIPSVFVHIGSNPSPQLISMAEAARYANSKSELFLITDSPRKWKSFPGEVIAYEKDLRHPLINEYIRTNKEKEGIAGGYWLYTLERLYALEYMYLVIEPNDSFLHYESDVLPMILEVDQSLFTSRNLRTAVPRFSTNRGIASIMYVPSRDDFKRVLYGLSDFMSNIKEDLTDMDILGKALNSGLIDELPTLPELAWEDSNGRKVIFDGAALGQYLFGQDPYHTQNRRISGFINEHFKSDLNKWKWNIVPREPEPNYLEVNQEGSKFRVLNLHIHSKLVLDPPGFSKEWTQALNEANGKSPRIQGDYVQNTIHTKRINVVNRIRIAKKRGLARSTFFYLLRKFKRIVNPK